MSVSPCELLQSTIEREIPICVPMGIRVQDWREQRLTVSLPLSANRNHKRTAFAGSLNALCTLVGWGVVFLLSREYDEPGDIVIRRSSIKYLQPVSSARVEAISDPIDPDALSYFHDMYREKGQSKLDLRVIIAGADGPAVSFAGSYVVLAAESD